MRIVLRLQIHLTSSPQASVYTSVTPEISIDGVLIVSNQILRSASLFAAVYNQVHFVASWLNSEHLELYIYVGLSQLAATMAGKFPPLAVLCIHLHGTSSKAQIPVDEDPSVRQFIKEIFNFNAKVNCATHLSSTLWLDVRKIYFHLIFTSRPHHQYTQDPIHHGFELNLPRILPCVSFFSSLPFLYRISARRAVQEVHSFSVIRGSVQKPFG